MVVEPVLCPTCESIHVFRYGKSAEGKSRYRCLNPDCQRNTFILNYSYQGRLPEVKQQIVEMALNGSGIRDTAEVFAGESSPAKHSIRVLKISSSTVIEELKKRARPKGSQ
jgi:transposase-like protein